MVLPCLRATNPKSLQGQERGERHEAGQEGAQALGNCPDEQTSLHAKLSPLALHISPGSGEGGLQVESSVSSTDKKAKGTVSLVSG